MGERAATVEEFEEQYAQRSGVTVEWLHENGRYGAPCDCGDDACEGFQMARYVDENDNRIPFVRP
jgi:hypothetical protein